jgi:hypothetical protein
MPFFLSFTLLLVLAVVLYRWARWLAARPQIPPMWRRVPWLVVAVAALGLAYNSASFATLSARSW